MRFARLVFTSVLASVTMAATAVAEEAKPKAKTTCTASGEASVCALGTVNGPLAGTESPPMLAIDVSIELKAADADALLAKDAEVRAAILAAIQAATESTATSKDGMTKLREDIHKAIDKALAPVQSERVYFTDWKVQPATK